MAAGRTISVVISGDSAELQASVDKSLKAIISLGDQIAKQSAASVAEGRKTIQSNEAVSASYKGLSAEMEFYAKRGMSTIVAANDRMLASQRELAVQGEAAMKESYAAMLEDQAAYSTRALSETEMLASRRVAVMAESDAKMIASQRELETALDASNARIGAGQEVAAAKTARGFGASGTALVGFGKKATLGLLGVGAASVYMAQKFEESTLRLQTQAGATHKELEKMREGALKMASSVGATPEQFESGLYHVASSMEKVLKGGNKVNEMLHITKVAMEGAAIGGTSQEETTYALTSALNALHLKASDAGKTMGELNAIVGSGDMTMHDLLEALKSGLIPTAGQFGVSLQSLGGALAVMGDMGMRGAQAGTRLRMSLALLGGPSKKAAEILQSLGLSGEEVHARTKGMTEALQASGISTTKLAGDLKKPDGIGAALKDLHQHLIDSGVGAETAAAIMVRAFGGGRMAATIDLLEQNTGRVGTKFKQIGDQAGEFGKDWAEVQKTFAFQMKELGSEVETFGITLGNKLIPYVRSFVGDLKEAAHWLHENKTAAELLGGALAGIVSIGVAAYAVNKVGKLAQGVKEAGKLIGLGSGVRGATPADPVWVKEVGGPGGGPGNVVKDAAKAGSTAETVAQMVERDRLAKAGGRLGSAATKGGGLPLAGGIAALIAGFAAGGKPGVTQTPGNIVNAQAHGVGHFLEGGPKAILSLLGIKTPSITDKLLPGVDHLGFDPMADPQAAVEYILTGRKPLKGTAGTPASSRKFIDKPSMGHPQASPAGVHPGDEPNRHEKGPDERLKYVKAAQALQTANREVASSEKRVNEIQEEGRKHTPEYTRAVKELATAQGEQKKAQAEVQATAPALNAAWAKVPNGINTAAKAYSSFPAIVKRYLHEAKTGMTTELTGIAQQTGPLSARAVQKITAQYNSLPPALKTALDNAGGEVAKGIDKINKATSTELKILGVAGGITADVSKAVSKIHLARGGLMQLGQPGEAGRDSIPMNVGGQQIVAAPGEQVAVLTRHQQADLAAKVPGGLASVFSNKRPNYMASGGFVAGPGTNYTVGEEPRIAADLRRLGEYLHKTLTGISGYRTPGHSVEVGGFSNDPHTRGEASDTPGTEGVSAAILAKFGLERPFPGAAEADHMQLLGSLGHPQGGLGPSVTGAAGSSGPAAAWKAIKAPMVGMGGAIGAIAQGALNKVASAANRKGQAAAGGAGGLNFSGVAGKGGSHSANEQLGKQMMIAAGWPASEWPALQALWTQESGWSDTSVNPSSGAYGIPQALGHGHPFNLGDARAQIAWGLNYIKGRYGSPSGAEAHERANNWYEQGGFLNAASGVPPMAAAAAKKKKLSAKTQPKGPGKKPGHHKPTKATFAQAMAPLLLLPDTEKLPPEFEKAEGVVSSLTNQASLLQALETAGKLNTFILPGDMSYIGPMSKFANVQAGMTTAQATTINEAAQLRNRQAQAGAKGKPTIPQEEEAEALTYQAEYIAWAAQQASHRKLTASDMGILGGTKIAGWAPKEGQNLWQAELTNAGLQREMLGAEEGTAKGGMGVVGQAIAEREKREKLVKAVMEKEKYRLDLTEGHIDHLESGSLRDKLAHARSQSEYQDRQTAARESVAQIQESIDHEKEAAKPDKKLLKQMETHKHQVSAAAKEGKPVSGSAKAAEVKILEHALKDQVKPIHDALSQLGGNEKRVQTKGGKYAELEGDIKRLKKDGKKIYEAAVEKIESTDLPMAELNMRSIEEAAADSPVPIFVPGSHEAEAGEGNKGELEALLKQQVQQLSETATIQGAQLATLKNFIPSIPHYEKGGPVVDDGLIYAHKGEHVVPAGGTLAINSSSPSVTVQNHIHGDIGPLIALIDSRVVHPENVRASSGVMGQRTQLFRGRI